MDVIANIDINNYQNHGHILPTDKAEYKIETSKPNEEKLENKNDKSNQDKANQELIAKLFKGVSGRVRSEFTYHKEVNRISIKMVNEETEEVIREIPPEKSIEILKKLMEIEGFFVDEKR